MTDEAAKEIIEKLDRLLYLLDAERGKVEKLKGAYEEYIELLNKEMGGLISIAYTHGWRSTLVEEGKQARKKIEQILTREG